MKKKNNINKIIILLTYVLAIILSEFLVHLQMIYFWEYENHTMGYWLGFWTPAIDALVVVVTIVFLKNYYEKELQKRAKRLEDFVEVTSDYVWELDSSGIITFVSGDVKSILGYTQKELLGKNISTLLSQLATNNTTSTFLELISKKVIIKDFQDWVTHKDGTQKLLIVNAIPVFEDNKFMGYRGASKDITEKVLNEQKLKEKINEQNSFVSLFEKGESVLFKFKNDNNFTIEYVSKNVENLLGYTKEELLQDNSSFLDLIHSEDLKRVQSEIEYIKESNGDYISHNIYRILTKDSDLRWILDDTVVIRNELGEIEQYVGYLIDITNIPTSRRATL